MKYLSNRIKQQTQKGIQPDLFKNEQGAIDLASIMVGIIVIGLIGGVIASTIFVVIPWTQDNAAKQQLDSVVSAESAYFGLSADNPPALPAGSKANSFGKSSELAAANLLQTGPRYCVTTPADGKSYDAYSQSSSGKLFTVTDKNSKPVIFTGTLPADCQFISDGVTSATPPPPAPYVDPTPTTTRMTFRCDVDTTGKLPVYANYSNLDGVETWSDGYTKNYKGLSYSGTINRTLLAGVTYTATYEGKYTNFSMFVSMDKCLRSIDHWGTGTGVTNASRAFSSSTLTSIPDHLPPTITDMSMMFYGATQLNPASVSDWDVSKVTNMEAMFRGATSFNQPLDKWNTSNVTTTKLMFYQATNFNKPLNTWDVSKVTDMGSMFRDSKFNQPLDKWTVTNVTNMDYMFNNATLFDQDISMWNVDKVSSWTSFATSSPIATKTAYLPKF